MASPTVGWTPYTPSTPIENMGYITVVLVSLVHEKLESSAPPTSE